MTAYRDDHGCRWTRDDPADTYSQGHYLCGSEQLRCAWANSACGACKLVSKCADYPDQRSTDYDPCGLDCP